MMDKNWLLNPTAISQARCCIKIIQDELGVKLKLSHPQFLELIVEYIDLTDSQQLADAYNELAGFAGPDLLDRKVVKLRADVATHAPSAPVEAAAISQEQQKETIEYQGRQYPRFSDCGEFKGLYRGQARYA